MPRLSAFIIAAFSICCLRPPAVSAAPAAPPAKVHTYARVLRGINPQLPVWQSAKLAKHLLINAVRWHVDANILVALVSVESAWHTHARSSAGAIGLGQLMPGTARTLRVNPRDPYQNLQGSARYLSRMLSVFQDSPNRYRLAFAAYNAGPKAVTAFGGIPPYAETQHYVVKVMSAWKRVTRAVHARAQREAVAPSVAVTYGSPDVQYWSAPK